MYPRRLSIPDARGQGATLRVTKHPEQRKIVLSHWRDGVCVASTPVELTEVPALIGVLADALGDAIDATPTAKQPAAERLPAVGPPALAPSEAGARRRASPRARPGKGRAGPLAVLPTGTRRYGACERTELAGGAIGDR